MILSDRLRESTAQVHQQLERSLIPTIKQIDTATYVRLLQMFYSFHAAVEPQLDKYLNDTLIPGYSNRRKAASLLEDLNYLGASASSKECEYFPIITNVPQAFGVMYVLEGSTLGGKIISQIISRQLGFQDTKGLSYYSGYGDDTDAMWLSFKDALNNSAFTAEETDEVVNAAADTFTSLKKWAELSMQAAVS